MVIHVPTNNQNFVLRNESDKGKYLFIESGDIRFITGIGETGERDDCH